MSAEERTKTNGLAIAGLVFGILSLLTAGIVVLVPLNAGLSVTFSLLSRGNGSMGSPAVIGIVLSVLSVFAALIVGLLLMSFGEGLLFGMLPIIG